MAEQAKVTSLEALESFRSHLIIFLHKARNGLDGVNEEIRRTRAWLQNDQRVHWEGEIRRSRRQLDQAKQELLTAKLATMKRDMTLQMNAVRRAEQMVATAEEKLRNVKRWSRDYDALVEPLGRKLESLRRTLDEDMVMATAFLAQIQKTLEGYAQTAPPPEASA